MTRCWLLGVALGVLSCGPLFAQTPEDRPIGRVEVDVGVGVLSGAGLGARDANLRAGGQASPPFPLFGTESRLAPAPTVHARVGFAFNRRFGVEGGVVVSRPEVRTSVSADVEDAPPLTIVARVDQYFIDASLIVTVEELRAGRLVPFVAVGAGYLRQLHEGLTVVEQGQAYHAGGGVRHLLLARDRGLVRAAGLRADARLYLQPGGISFDGRARRHAAISGGAFVVF